MCQFSTAEKATVPGECEYLNLSKVTLSREDGLDSNLSKKYWKIVVDQATGKRWHDFFQDQGCNG